MQKQAERDFDQYKNMMDSNLTKATSGDGQNADSLPKVTVSKNNHQARHISYKNNRAQPVSISYTDRSTDDIINDQFRSADAHAKSIKKAEENVYMIIKAAKAVLAGAMVIGGATFVSGWTPQGGAEVSRGLTAMSVIIFCIGPMLAYALDHYIEQGVFLGLSKLIAWFVIIGVIVEEVLAVKAMRDLAFADVLMIEIAPYAFGALIFSLVMLGYLRRSLKRRRDLMQMKQKEEETLAKNATKSRQLKANNEARDLRMTSIGTGFTSTFQTALSIPVLAVLGLCRAIKNIYNESWQATDVAAAAKGRKAKKGGSRTKK